MALVSTKIISRKIVRRFKSDSDFYQFCKSFKPVVKVEDSTGLEFFEYPFEKDDEWFLIDDPNSLIMKTGYATIGTMKVRVPNICVIEDN